MYTINYRSITFLVFIAFLGTGCSEEGVIESTGSNTNTGTVSQKHFFIGLDPVSPTVFDRTNNTFDLGATTTVTATVGDRNNQLLTDSHTVHFETEWGLIEPSCVTQNGKCSVEWAPTSTIVFPEDLNSTIVAYTIGEETFEDLNNNGTFDDGESFIDSEEPWVNRDATEVFLIYDELDQIIDTVNGNDLTGKNLVHDIADGFFNGPGCTHSSLCSEVLRSTTVWDMIEMDITGGTEPSAP